MVIEGNDELPLKNKDQNPSKNLNLFPSHWYEVHIIVHYWESNHKPHWKKNQNTTKWIVRISKIQKGIS